MTHIVVLYALIATLGTWSVTALGAATVIFFRKQNQESDAGICRRRDDCGELLVAAPARH